MKHDMTMGQNAKRMDAWHDASEVHMRQQAEQEAYEVLSQLQAEDAGEQPNRRWHMAHLSIECDESDETKLLNDGYEPFAVSGDEIWFRKFY